MPERLELGVPGILTAISKALTPSKDLTDKSFKAALRGFLSVRPDFSLYSQPRIRSLNPRTTTNTVGRMILHLRNEQKLSPAEFAARVGISTSTLANWELENNSPKEEGIRAAAEVLGVDPGELFKEPQVTSQHENYQIKSTQESR